MLHAGSKRRLAIAVAAVLLWTAAPAAADPHDSSESGHPLRIVAYIVHPVGVFLDTLIFRPAHWLVHRGSLKELFGHEC